MTQEAQLVIGWIIGACILFFGGLTVWRIFIDYVTMNVIMGFLFCSIVWPLTVGFSAVIGLCALFFWFVGLFCGHDFKKRLF